MYKELEKYNTGIRVPRTYKVECNGYSGEITSQELRYSANLGNLIEDFINHKNKPWYKRKYYHEHLTKIYKDWLNEVSILKYF